MNNLDKILEELESSIKYLVKYERQLPGLTNEDLAQELRLLVVQNFNYNQDKTKGWWFLKLKWYLMALINKVRMSKKPLDNIDYTINLNGEKEE